MDEEERVQAQAAAPAERAAPTVVDRGTAARRVELLAARRGGAPQPAGAAVQPSTTGAAAPTTLPPEIESLQAEANGLLSQARALRRTLDNRTADSQPDPAQIQQLGDLRRAQIPLWTRLVSALQQNGTSAPGGPLEVARDRLSRLERWQSRQHIREIGRQLGTARGPARAELQAARSVEAQRLLDGFQELRQDDTRWSNDLYLGNGTPPDRSSGQPGTDTRSTLYNQRRDGRLAPSTIGEGGCGLASLAMMLQFADREDPEGVGRTDEDAIRHAGDFISRSGCRGVGQNTFSGPGPDGAPVTGREAVGTEWGRLAARIDNLPDHANLDGDTVQLGMLQRTVERGQPVVWKKRHFSANLTSSGHFVVIRSFDAASQRYVIADPASTAASDRATFDEIVANNDGLFTLVSRY